MSSKQVESRRFGSTIRFRLTLWWTAITLCSCAALCLLLYFGLSYSLRREVDSFLKGEVQEFTSILNEEEHHSFAEIEADIRHELGSRLRGDLTFRLVGEDAGLVFSSDAHDVLTNDDGAGTQVVDVEGPVCTTEQPASTSWPYRVCSQQVDLANRGRYQAQAAYRMDQVAASLTGFRRLSVAAMAIATGLSVVCGVVLAGKSLRPVQQMTNTARHIGAQNLAERLARSRNGDELDDLAGVLNEMLARIERQFGEVQRFTADAAHELRTPLAALRCRVELALDHQCDENEWRQLLEESLGQFDTLSRITNDLLLLARADAGRNFLNLDRFDLTETIRDLVDLYSATANEHRIELVCERMVAIEVDADAMRIRQLFSNLLDNALKYTPPGGRVTVGMARYENKAEVRVCDNGPGIAPEHIAHVFDRFYRVDAARTRTTGGCGLGLSICRSIAEAHGGTITMASRLDVGTEVVVRLPANRKVSTTDKPTAHT
ncbi:MAG: heavy metal sensor histidine kinase [Phycisphaerales bacterium]|nr:heavy metal sensor histidine kinase [Phycisphaerales bacterium]